MTSFYLFFQTVLLVNLCSTSKAYTSTGTGTHIGTRPCTNLGRIHPVFQSKYAHTHTHHIHNHDDVQLQKHRINYFQPIGKHTIERFPSFPLLNSSNSNNGDSDGSNNSKKNSIARAGGRNRAGQSSKNAEDSFTNNDNNNNNDKGGIIDLAKKAIPLLIAFTLLKGILGSLFGFGMGMGGNQSVVYYQSTVYESRTYDADGKMERIRKESVKSNIPSMINGNRYDDDDNDNDNKGTKSSLFFKKNLDVDVDTYVDEALERSYGRSIVVEDYDEY